MAAEHSAGLPHTFLLTPFLNIFCCTRGLSLHSPPQRLHYHCWNLQELPTAKNTLRPYARLPHGRGKEMYPTNPGCRVSHTTKHRQGFPVGAGLAVGRTKPWSCQPRRAAPLGRERHLRCARSIQPAFIHRCLPWAGTAVPQHLHQGFRKEDKTQPARLKLHAPVKAGSTGIAARGAGRAVQLHPDLQHRLSQSWALQRQKETLC